MRDLSKTELAEAAAHAEEEADVAADHAREFLPQSTVYLHAEKLGVEDAVRGRLLSRRSAGRRAASCHHLYPSFPARLLQSIKEINATQAAYEAQK